MEQYIEKLKIVLQNKGFKATPARIVILSVFENERKPMNAEEICLKIKKNARYNIDMVTVYRNLTAFLKTGILRKIDLRQDSVYFELNDTHHHHIVCTQCGLVEEFENEKIEKLAKKIVRNSTHFKKVAQHSFEFFGLCNTCIHTKK